MTAEQEAEERGGGDYEGRGHCRDIACAASTPPERSTQYFFLWAQSRAVQREGRAQEEGT